MPSLKTIMVGDRGHLKPLSTQRVCVHVKLRHGQFISVVNREVFQVSCDARQGPHHGAQKSTSSGVGFSRTSGDEASLTDWPGGS